MCTSRHPPEYIGRHVDKAICTELFKKSLESFKRGFLLKFQNEENDFKHAAIICMETILYRSLERFTVSYKSY